MPVKFENEQFALSEQVHVMPIDDTGFSPIADAGNALLRELARVGWAVPDIEVKFTSTDLADGIVRAVSCIRGRTEEGPFSLYFGDSHEARRLREWKGRCLTGAKVPPGLDVHYFSDDSGPDVTLYVGDDWQRDGDAFVDKIKTNSKLNGEPKTYLKYDRNSRGAAVLHADNDLGREYDPEGDEPEYLTMGDLKSTVTDFLGRLVDELKALPSAPGHDDVTHEGDANLRRLAHVEPIPAPEDFPKLYVWMRPNDAHRAWGYDEGRDVKGRITGNGWRVCSLGTRDVPEESHRGFTYAGTDVNTHDGHHVYAEFDASLPIRVELKHLNDIYVVDKAVFERIRNEIFDSVRDEGRERLTDAEMSLVEGCVGRTIVPASEYAGDFDHPLYCIGRRLEADEAIPMHGHIRLEQDDKGARAVFEDVGTGERVVVASQATGREHALQFVERMANDAIHAFRSGQKPVAFERADEPEVELPRLR